LDTKLSESFELKYAEKLEKIEGERGSWNIGSAFAR